MDERPEGKKGSVPEKRGDFRIYLAFGLVIIISAFFYRHQMLSALYRLEISIDTMGSGAIPIMMLVSGLWATLCLPGPLMLGLVGTMFSSHPLYALAVVVVGDTIAEVIGFLVARHYGRERFREWLSDKSWFEWLEEHTRERGVYGVFLIRLMPFFPNSLANYAFGLTALKFWPYLVASVLGSIPNLALYVTGTAGIVHLLRDGWGAPESFLRAVLVLVAVGLVLKGIQAWLRRRERLSEERST